MFSGLTFASGQQLATCSLQDDAEVIFYLYPTQLPLSTLSVFLVSPPWGGVAAVPQKVDTPQMRGAEATGMDLSSLAVTRSARAMNSNSAPPQLQRHMSPERFFIL